MSACSAELEADFAVWRALFEFEGVSDSTSFQLDDRPPGDLCSKSINFMLRAFSLGARALTFAILAPPRIDTFPFESDSGTMRKVLKWGAVPLNLEGHGMNPHSFSWASTNSPVNIRDFNHSTRVSLQDYMYKEFT